MSLEIHTPNIASVKRIPMQNGVRSKGNAQTVYYELACSDPFPTDILRRGALLKELGIETLHHLYDVFVAGDAEILPGDLLIMGQAEYTIRAAARWPSHVEPFSHLTVQRVMQ